MKKMNSFLVVKVQTENTSTPKQGLSRFAVFDTHFEASL